MSHFLLLNLWANESLSLLCTVRTSTYLLHAVVTTFPVRTSIISCIMTFVVRLLKNNLSRIFFSFSEKYFCEIKTIKWSHDKAASLDSLWEKGKRKAARKKTRSFVEKSRKLAVISMPDTFIWTVLCRINNLAERERELFYPEVYFAEFKLNSSADFSKYLYQINFAHYSVVSQTTRYACCYYIDFQG